MVDVLPRQLGHVDEPVHAAEVDEGTEVDHRGHHAPAALAGLQVDEELAALLLLGLLEPGPAGQHDVVAVAVELDDLGLDGPTHVGLELAHPAQLDQRRGQEAPQSDVDDEPALDHFDDRAGDDVVGLLELLDRAPGPLVLGPLLRQDEPTLFVLLLEDEGLDRRRPRLTISEGSTSLRMESSRTGMTPSDLKPMSRRTSSLSILTTVPSTRSPSSNSTMVPAMASSRDAPPRSSSVTERGMYSPFSSKVPMASGDSRAVPSGTTVCIGHEVGSSLSGRVHRARFRAATGEGSATTVVAGRTMLLHRSADRYRAPGRGRSALLGLGPRGAPGHGHLQRDRRGRRPRSAPPRSRAATVIGLVGDHVDQHLVVDLEDQVAMPARPPRGRRRAGPGPP